MKVAIYARKSKYSVTSESVNNQIDLCKKLALELGISENNIFLYEDDGLSGANDNRPSYKMMLNDITHKPNGFTHVICYKIDRLSRNVYDFANFLVTLKKHNIQLKSFSDSFDASTVSGEAMLYILSVFSQLERELISSRIKDNMYSLAKSGRWLGGNYPFGFKSEKFPIYDSNFNEGYISSITPDETKLEIVKSIFTKYIELKSIRGVASYLYKNNILTSKGNHFQDTAIRKILRNPVYAKSSNEICDYLTTKGFEVIGIPDEKHGFLTYAKTSKNYSGHIFTESDVDIDSSAKSNNALAVVASHDGIIDADIWLTTQNILDENYTNNSPRTGTGALGILSGILKCSECGSSMNVTYSIKKRKDGSQKKYYYYTCSKKVHVDSNACICKSISGDVIDTIASKAICNLTLDDVISYAKNYKKELFTDKTYIQTKITLLEENIAQKKKELERLIHNFSLISDDTVVPVISNAISLCSKKINELENKLNSLYNETFKLNNKYLDTGNVIQEFKDLNHTFNICNIEKQRSLVRTLIEKVIWNHNTNELTIFYKDTNICIN